MEQNIEGELIRRHAGLSVLVVLLHYVYTCSCAGNQTSQTEPNHIEI